MNPAQKKPDPVAVALMSGGLDSQIAARMVAEQGVDVRALTFMTSFGCGPGEGGACGHDPATIPMHPKIKIKLAHLGQEYIDMVMDPKHGYGKNANPCIDCRAMMLRWADEYAKTIGADFLVTGEVLNQRPMSQRKNVMPQIEREAGVAGRVLRPLSARLLPETEAESRGLVDREKLGAISGRSRKPQMALAPRLGIERYPTPAGGCLLTDPHFGRRFHDLRKHQKRASVTDIDLLKVGRHFRLNERCKLVVGRNHQENLFLLDLWERGDLFFVAHSHPGPSATVRGELAPDKVGEVASLIASYGKGDPGEAITLRFGPSRDPEEILTVSKPESRELFAHLAIR